MNSLPENDLLGYCLRALDFGQIPMLFGTYLARLRLKNPLVNYQTELFFLARVIKLGLVAYFRSFKQLVSHLVLTSQLISYSGLTFKKE